MREVAYRLPQGLAILKKYRGQDLNRFVFSIEEESDAETQGELDREVKGPAGKEMKSEQDREVKRLPGKEIKSERDREVKRHPSQETKSEPDAKQQLTQVSNLLENEFNEFIHFGACKKSDLIACDEESYTQLIINPEFEANLFSYYMNYVAQIMFEQELAGEFSSYAAVEMALPHTTHDLVEAFKFGKLYKAKILVDSGVDPNAEIKEEKEPAIIKSQSFLCLILNNFRIEAERRKIYKDPHTQLAALNLLLSGKKPVNIARLPDNLLFGISLIGNCYPDAFSRFVDWILKQESGMNRLQEMLLYNDIKNWSAIHNVLINGMDFTGNRSEICLILLRKIKISAFLLEFRVKIGSFSIAHEKTLIYHIVHIILYFNMGSSYDFLDLENSNHFVRLDQFKDLLIILRTQCVKPDFYLILAENVANTLERLMLILEFYPALAEKFDWNKPRSFKDMSCKVTPVILAVSNGQAEYLAKILSIPNVNPNVCDEKGAHPLVCAIRSGKNAKQQLELVRLFLENKKLIIKDEQEIVSLAVSVICRPDTFKLLINRLKINIEILLNTILSRDAPDKFGILLQNLFIMENLVKIPKSSGECGKIIRYLLAVAHATDSEKIILNYIKYSLLEYPVEKFESALMLPALSPEIKMIIKRQCGEERVKIIVETITTFNVENKFQPILEMLLPDNKYPIPSDDEFKKSAHAFLDETGNSTVHDEKWQGIFDKKIYNQLTTLVNLYLYRKRTIDSGDGHARLRYFVSILFRLVAKRRKVSVIADFLWALRNINDICVFIFLDEFVADGTIIKNEEFFVSIFKDLEKKKKNSNKNYLKFIKSIFNELRKYSNFSKCTELNFYICECLYNTRDHYVKDTVKKSIRAGNNILLGRLLKFLKEKGYKDDHDVLSLAAHCKNHDAMRILLSQDYISMLSLSVTILCKAVESNCSLDIIKSIFTFMPLPGSNPGMLESFLSTSIAGAQYDLILLAGTRIRRDYLLELKAPHALYNVVKNIYLALLYGNKSIDEINALLNDFDLVSKGSEFSRVDLIKIIRTQLVDHPKLYEILFVCLFDQTIPKSAADAEQKMLPDQKLVTNLIEALEVKPLNFLCDAIKQGNTKRVIHALNNEANPDVIDSESKYTALQLVIRNGAVNAPPIFSEQDQLLIINTILSWSPNLQNRYSPWDTLYKSAHCGFSIYLKFSTISSLQLLVSIPPVGHIATAFIIQMMSLWKICSTIDQSGQYQQAADLLYTCLNGTAVRANRKLMENIFNELKSQSSGPFKYHYYTVISACYKKLLMADSFYPALLIKFCQLAWMEGDRISAGVEFMPLKTMVMSDRFFFAPIFFDEAITSNRDYFAALTAILNRETIPMRERQDLLSQFLRTDKYQCEDEKRNLYPIGDAEAASLCQYTIQSGDAKLLTKSLTMRDNPAALIDDFKSYPVQLALCQHPEWLEVKESKQSLLSFTAAQPKNATRVIAYFKQILPKAPKISVLELTSLHTTLLAAHKITLDDIMAVELHMVIFKIVLQPRIKLSDPVDRLTPSLRADRESTIR